MVNRRSTVTLAASLARLPSTQLANIACSLLLEYLGGDDSGLP
jgi:hypothetical protein